MHEEKQMIHLPFDVLPEGKHWEVGQSYRVKLVLRQVGQHEDSADFEVVDATSLEADDKAKRKFMMTTDGVYKS